MKNRIIGFVIGLMLMFAVMYVYQTQEYIKIRSEVFRATGYDITYHEKCHFLRGYCEEWLKTTDTTHFNVRKE